MRSLRHLLSQAKAKQVVWQKSKSHFIYLYVIEEKNCYSLLPPSPHPPHRNAFFENYPN